MKQAFNNKKITAIEMNKTDFFKEIVSNTVEEISVYVTQFVSQSTVLPDRQQANRTGRHTSNYLEQLQEKTQSYAGGTW